MNILLIIIGKLFSYLSSILKLGNGSTWPGHIALKFNRDFVQDVLKNSKTKLIFVTGTNGKTTTAKLIETILKENGKSVFVNESGANLLNGVASSLILKSDFFGKIKEEYAVFEIDENALIKVSETIMPDYLISLNLFRDQLDRYGEVDSIVKNWEQVFDKIKDKTLFILNADDPQIAYLGLKHTKNSVFFGLNDTSIKTALPQHASDSILCPNCFSRLTFSPIYYSHLGNWSCPNCKLKRPKLDIEKSSIYPLEGVYNMYNTLAAILFSGKIGIEKEDAQKALKNFTPAFGRQEEIVVDNKKVKFFLSKNPTSFNESLKTIASLGAKYLLIILNDRIPDGRDVSWIWDVDFEIFINSEIKLFTAGDRAYDMALRIKYSDLKSVIFEDLNEAINKSLITVPNGETLYILPTYSAMLETRKILTGKKIL